MPPSDTQAEHDARITAMVKKYAKDYPHAELCSTSAKLFALECTLEGVTMANSDWFKAYARLEDVLRQLGRRYYDREMLRLEDIDGVELVRKPYEGSAWHAEVEAMITKTRNEHEELEYADIKNT